MNHTNFELDRLFYEKAFYLTKLGKTKEAEEFQSNKIVRIYTISKKKTIDIVIIKLYNITIIIGGKNMKNKIIVGIVGVCMLSITFGFGKVANAEVVGGWSEESGSYTETTIPNFGMMTRAAVRHTGKAEEKNISGTTHKRAHGWTTWSGVYHYTTARLEHYWPGSGVNGTSGRIWGRNGTEAISPYKPYTRDSSPGAAKTYYGN